MEIYEYEKSVEGYIKWLKDLSKTDPELAKEIAKKSLIEPGVLNKDCISKERIVDNPSQFEGLVKPKQKIRKLKK